jgi:large subunit ribosomal protein L4
MVKTNVFDMTGKVIGEIELCDSVFGIEPNEVALHESVKNYLANQRQGTQSTLTRAEVRGGGRKPWKQKGTGHARQGSIRAPQWTHGGIALGPKPRSYRYTLNKKQRRLALCSALSAKAQAGDIVVVDGLHMDEIKTKNMVSFLNAVSAGKALIVTPELDRNVVLSARNIPGVKTTFSSILSVYDILKADKFVVDKAAVAKIEEVYAK